MYCTNCGTQVGDADKFCRECACETKVGRDTRNQNASAYAAPRRLYRVTSESRIAGVCAGLARYFEVDVTLVRLLVVAGALCSGGLGLLAYIAAWMIMPRENLIASFRATQTAV